MDQLTINNEPASLIEVRQLPVIAERLRQVKDQVEAMTTEASSLICTAETVQAVKQKRADLRKQFEELESQRKSVKTAVMGPYEEFVKVYDECISAPFRIADNKLKEQIDSFEGELKARCEERLRQYQAEMATVHGVEFLTYEKAMQLAKLKISMADANAKTPKKLMDGLAEITASVACGVDRILRMENCAEILAEYKKCFDVGEAIATVEERIRRVAEEERQAEIRKEAEAKKAEAVAKVEALTAPVETDPEEEKIFTIRFTVKCTKAQGRKLKEFLIKEGIRYE